METWQWVVTTLVTIITIILTSRKNKVDRDRGLVAGALELVESLRQQVNDLEKEVETVNDETKAGQHVHDQADARRQLRSSIERMERTKLEEQNSTLRMYCQTLLGKLEQAKVSIPKRPDAMDHKLTILIVSNDNDVTDQLRSMMPLYPYELRIATTVSDAQAMIESVHFDAVVIDWGVRSNGAEAYKAIIETDAGPHVVSILVSGGLDGIITTYKPISIEQAISEILDQRKVIVE